MLIQSDRVRNFFSDGRDLKIMRENEIKKREKFMK